MNKLNDINLLNNINQGPKFKKREIYSSKNTSQNKQPQLERKPKKPWKIIISSIVIFIIILVALSTNIIFSSDSLLDDLTDIKPQEKKTGFWGKVKQLVGVEPKLLDGEAEDRINILLLGQGGAGHEGPYLTDTIILASLKPSTNQVATISIPRDLYVPVTENGWRRINYANSFGEVELNGRGGEITSQTVSEVFNLPIHYYARIDFQGFKEVIDDLGGVNVYIERNFSDSSYPTSDFGTTTISFDAGWQKMDGETALQFARSRHGNNNEGSDFARAKRQQKIMIAIKNKAFSFGSLFRPDKFIKAAKDFNKHFETSLKTWEILRLSQFAKKIDLEKIISRVLDDSPAGPLVPSITEDGAYVLKTKTKNFSELASIAENIFLSPNEAQIKKANEYKAEKNNLLKKIKQEGGHANIIVQNGTLRSGLAKKAADYLASLEFKVLEFGNAQTQDIEKTIIYDFTDGKKEANQELLEKELAAKTKKADLSDYPGLNSKIKFLIILGNNYTEPIIPQNNLPVDSQQNEVKAETTGPQMPTSTDETE
ncbi:LCP family protein [Candidatus Falkowbacteria bacterium]|nr:LCP family protein [Candidatus Falkowbacteria bacterium]